jgi:hypothetical protein
MDMAIVENVEEESHFVNVDLDIYSASNLEPLVAAMGKRVDVLFLGGIKRTYQARLELCKTIHTPDATILGFCALILMLPKAERKLWDGAKIRELNIGLQIRMKPTTYKIMLSEKTVRAASEVNARIKITMYSPATETIHISAP